MNKYLISTAGRWHHFELAKILNKQHRLSKIVSGYPWFKLKKEKLPKKLVEAHGFLRVLRTPIITINSLKKINDYLNISSEKNIDRIASRCFEQDKNINVFLGQSQCSLNTGKKFRKEKKLRS